MATHTLAVEVPDELLRLLGSPEAAAVKAREALVMELLRESALSQGQAAPARPDPLGYSATDGALRRSLRSRER